MYKIDIEGEYEDLSEDLYKVIVILIVFHIIMNLQYNGKVPLDLCIGGGIFNENFLILLGSIILSFMAYELVFKKILKIK